jgi:hypothetical protein
LALLLAERGGRTVVSAGGGPSEEQVLAIVAPLDPLDRWRTVLERGWLLLTLAVVVLLLGWQRTSVWTSLLVGAGVALVLALTVLRAWQQIFRHRLDTTRERWRMVQEGPGGAEAPVVLARVSLAVPAAAELLPAAPAGPAAPEAAPAPAERPTRRPGPLAGLRLPLGLPRLGRRSRSRALPGEDVRDASERQEQRDGRALFRSLLGRDVAHALAMLGWWVLPFAVWGLAAAVDRSMSFWRFAFAWLLLCFVMAIPSITRRNDALDRARRAFAVLFPVGEPARAAMLAELEELGRRHTILRELIIRLRANTAPAPANTQPVEQTLAAALEQAGITPSSPVAPVPPVAPPARAPAPTHRSEQPSVRDATTGARSLPLTLPGPPRKRS